MEIQNVFTSESYIDCVESHLSPKFKVNLITVGCVN